MKRVRNKTPQDESTVPDTARVYERARPECESGMGRLDNNKATPADHGDRMIDAVRNKQPHRQINSEEEQISKPVEEDTARR
jgi:triphosphoribosyl-dephospho-CoA synthetase